MMQWYRILTEEQVSKHLLINKPLPVLIGNLALALVWDGHTFFAFKNACPHNKAKLSDGKINAFGEVICPWHEYRFNLKTGQECAQRSSDLQTYSVEKRPDGLYVFCN